VHVLALAVLLELLSAPVAKPRVLALVVVDQMPIRLWDRLVPELPPGGVRRLVSDGAAFTAAYGHSMTVTAAGHALLATGADAGRTGIVDNEWVERHPWRRVHADDDEKFGTSPANLRALTFADSLVATTAGRARIVSVSLKSRAAVLLAGRHPTAVVWYDVQLGQWKTSAYYGTLPAWAAQSDPRQQIGHDWRPSLDGKKLARLGGPDEAPGEGNFAGLGTAFPHPVDSALALQATPAANDLIMDLALAGAAAEGLGKDDVPDLLLISLSGTDYVGHVFGPDSQEAVDAFFRMDRAVARLLAWLDRHVGAGKYDVVLTSDHGATSLPERNGAVRLPPDGEIGWNVEKQLAPGHEVAFIHPNLFIEPRDPAALKTARAVLQSMRGVERVLDASDLVAPGDDVTERVARSWDAERSGDLYVVLAPNCVFEENMTLGAGTGHGAPRDYDSEVPLVFFGAGVKPRAARERVAAEAVAPTIAALLGVPAPPAASAKAIVLH
jgi:hypothetical protein